MQRSWICVGASVVVRTVLEPGDELTEKLWLTWESQGRSVVAPALLHYEVTNALYQYQRLELLSPSSVRLALRTALALPVRVQHEADLHWQAMAIAERFSLPATYDAHYLALAERLGAEFWTVDRRLAQRVLPTLDYVHLCS